jgi:hypothetical protein
VRKSSLYTDNLSKRGKNSISEKKKM